MKTLNLHILFAFLGMISIAVVGETYQTTSQKYSKWVSGLTVDTKSPTTAYTCIIVNIANPFTLKYSPKKLKSFTYVSLPLALIEKSMAERLDSEITYFLRLRHLNRRPVHYNFSYADLGRKINCSPSTLHRTVKRLISIGLASIKNGNLHLTSTHALKAEYKTTLMPVKIVDNKRDQLTLLRATLIRRNIHKQYKSNTLRQNILDIPKSKCKLSSRQIKQVRKKQNALPRYKNAEIGKHDEFMLSNKSFGSICNRSQRTGIKIQKALNNLKVIKSSKNVVKIEKLNPRAFREKYISNKYSLSKMGLVFLILPNRIALQ